MNVKSLNNLNLGFLGFVTDSAKNNLAEVDKKSSIKSIR